jgi:type II secretory pathway pseudopilin PulG
MQRKSKQAGFSLIEAAMSLTLMGLVMAVAVPTLIKYQTQLKYKETEKNQELVIRSIAAYLLQNRGKPPIPADPSNNNAESFGKSAPEPYERLGIVPFKTLGIPESVAKDGFKRYFTYAIASRLEKVGMFEMSANESTIVVRDEHGNKPHDDQQFIPFVLISHGEQGGGAFQGGGQLPPQGPDEAINARQDFVFVDKPLSSIPGNEFGHRVKWVTNKNLLPLYGYTANKKEQKADNVQEENVILIQEAVIDEEPTHNLI